MNKKVFATMLVLCIAFLTGLYVLKIFFPQDFVMVVSNENIVNIGNFIDSQQWLYIIVCSITSFITYWLFMCACKHEKTLNLKETILVVIFIVLARVVNFFDANIATHISIITFFVIPLICKFDLKVSVIVYVVHGLAQILSLSIRSLPMYLTSVNFATMFLLGIESYLWLLLFYIIYNYKNKKEKEN